MTDLLKLYSLADLEGVVQCGSVALTGITVIQTMPDLPCKFAMLSSWTVGDDTSRTVKTGASAATKGSGSAGQEIYWGFNLQIFGQLFTGERTELLPVNNLNQLCVKGAGRIYYAVFR